MRIDTLQMECFLSVAAHLNFTVAANEMFISQPAISRKVAALEKELGVVLIDRSCRELKLTESGEEMRAFFLTFIQQLDEIKYRLLKDTGSVCEELHIGIFEGWSLSAFLRKTLRDFKMIYEGVEIIIDACSEKDLINGLKTGRYDVVFLLKISIKCALNRGYINNVSVYDLIDVHKKLYFSSHNALAGKQDLTMADFEKQTLYTFRSDIVPLDIIMNKELCTKYGIKPNVKVLSTLDAVLSAISTGSGFAMFDELNRIKYNSEFMSLKLKDKHGISMVVSKETTSCALETFVKYCDEIGYDHIISDKV